MEVTVYGKHQKLPVPVRAYAAEKLSHLAKYLHTISSIDVQLYEDGKKPRNGRSHVAAVAVRTPGPVFRARAVTGSYRVSVDLAYERLERRVKEFKRKRSGKPAHQTPVKPLRLNSQVESADKRQRV